MRKILAKYGEDENLVADRNRWGFIKSNIGRKKKTKWNSERMRKILAKYGEDENLVADRNRWGFIKSNIGRKKTKWNSERMRKILAKYGEDENLAPMATLATRSPHKRPPTPGRGPSPQDLGLSAGFDFR